jgi:hypothetical protein
MTEKMPQGRTRTLTRTDRLVLAFVAPPFFGLCSFALIVYVAELLGYDLYGHIDLGIIAWVVSQLLACLLLTTALAVSAAMRVGNLASCTLLGAAAGVAAWFLIGMEVRLERGLWLVPFQ